MEVDAGSRADAGSLSLKRSFDPLAFLWAEGAATQLEHADLKPADAGDARQLALGYAEGFSA